MYIKSYFIISGLYLLYLNRDVEETNMYKWIGFISILCGIFYTKISFMFMFLLGCLLLKDAKRDIHDPYFMIGISNIIFSLCIWMKTEKKNKKYSFSYTPE